MNSAILVATTHRRLGRMSDGTSTQVMACIINRWMAKISQKMLYNVRDPSGRRESSSENLKNTVTQRIEIVIKSKKNILKNYSSRTLPRKDFFVSNLFFFDLFHS